MKKKKFIIIDANSLIHRAFHALPPLTTKDGILVNAVYGFTTILLKALKEFKPDYIACCFDVDKNTFRKKEYKEYKAHRKEQPSELYHQFPLIKELLESFKIPVYEKQGYEADDVIGTISERVGKKYKDIKKIIVSGDLDILQLVDDDTEVYTMKRGISDTIIYNESAVKERFCFGSGQLIDYKALRGDASDNIPGVKGIGEKTATELIKKYNSLDNIYTKIKKTSHAHRGVSPRDSILKESVIKKLLDNKKQAYLSQMLATIVRDVKIDFDLEDTQVEAFDVEHVVQLFQAWNFNRLITQIPQAEKIMKEKQGTLFSKEQGTINKTQEKFKIKDGYHLIDNKEKLDEFIKKLEKQKQFTVDTETDGLNPFKAKLIGISFSWENGRAWYLPILSNHTKKETGMVDVPSFSRRGGSRRVERSGTSRETGWLISLKQILENPRIKKIGHNIKFDLEVLQTAGINMQGIVFDTMIASYLLNPGSRQHNLDALAFVELGYKMQSITELIGEKKSQQISLAEVPVDQVANYSCEDADITWQLYSKLSEKLDDEIITNILEKIEVPLISVLADMERNGIKLDVKFLHKMSKNLEVRIKGIETRIYKIAGEKFNVASPKQLKEILFDKLKISTQGLSKTKTGISTAAGELEKLRKEHKIIELIIEFRELSKLKNTYLDPLPELVDKNNRIHTSFNQTITATGRLSSSEPNLQNIPIRGDLGKEVRKAFIAEKGYKILAADYSQIELRVIASLANDKKMLHAFDKNQDIHTATASEVFNVAEDKVTRDMRRQAKVVNFGIIYGLGARGLAAGTGMSYEQAQEFINKYFEIYNDIKDYIEQTIALTRELGYVETLFGRRRYLPEISANHQQMRSAAERMAINHPVQGCLHFNTRVLTSGGYKKIGWLYETNNKKPKYVWNGSKWCNYKVLNRGKADLAQIIFNNGQILNCDTRHEVLAVDDYGYRWIDFKNLKKGMKVCFSYPEIIDFKEKEKFSFNFKANVHNSKDLKFNKLDSVFWYWIGYYYGDGYLGKRKDKNRYRYTLNYYFGKKEQNKAEECIKYFKSLGLNPRIREFTGPSKSGSWSTRLEVSISSHGLGKLFEEIGIKGFINAHTKRLPDLIFCESLINRREFIRGLMDSDGYYGKNREYVPNIHLCQRDLLADIQILLRTLGVDSKLRGPYKNKEDVSFRLDMPRKSLFKALNIDEKFQGTHYNHKPIPEFILKELLEKYPNLTKKNLKTESDYVLYNRWKNGGNSSIYHFIDWLERNKLKLDLPVYLWHKVKNIKKINKKEDTYTLSVKDESHRFDSEGIISKNTAADLIKMAMINLHKRINKEFVKDEVYPVKSATKGRGAKQFDGVRMLLQVHDELVFEVRDDLVNHTKKIIQNEMEMVYKLKAPIEVEVGVGDSWGTAK